LLGISESNSDDSRETEDHGDQVECWEAFILEPEKQKAYPKRWTIQDYHRDGDGDTLDWRKNGEYDEGSNDSSCQYPFEFAGWEVSNQVDSQYTHNDEGDYLSDGSDKKRIFCDRGAILLRLSETNLRKNSHHREDTHRNNRH
jgi:hypothetical protein